METSASPPFVFASAALPARWFTVHSLRGVEALSSGYRFDVVVTSERLLDRDLERLVLGRRAALVVRAGGRPRAIHGVVSAVRALSTRGSGGAGGTDKAQHRLRLVPEFELLRHQRRSRIFEGMSVSSVVDEVLGGALPRWWALARPLPSRPYITQYEETDKAFVERLLAEAGVFYWFQQPDSALSLLDGASDATVVDAILTRETIVFGDQPSAYAPIHAVPPSLQYLPHQGLGADRAGKVLDVTPERRLAAHHAEFRDYDPDRPGFRVGGKATAPERAPDEVELHFEQYEHHGRSQQPDLSDDAREAQRILTRARRRVEVIDGRSLSAAAEPGRWFELEDHPVPAMNRPYVFTRVRHEGSVAGADETYENTFECVPAETAFPPARVKRKTVLSMLTAVVVGPTPDAVHVDAAGRIQIQFHWDRDGAGGACWIRTIQSWAGAGWGHQFIPRVGMEVAVVFDGGDPDKPVVAGCLYNGTHPMPFPLPHERDRSGIRTRTIGGSGTNELSFRDAPDREQIYVHAERDLDEVVRHDRSSIIHGDARSHVHGHQEERVGENAHLEVGRDRVVTIAGDQTTLVQGARSDVCERGSSTRVGGLAATIVEGIQRIDVTGSADHHFATTLTTRVGAHSTTIVGQHEAPGASAHHVEGSSVFSASGVLELSSATEIVLRVGSSVLRIGKDRIDLGGSAFGALGGGAGIDASKDGLKLVSDGSAQLVAKDLILKTEGASFAMGSEIKADGERILLNSPEQAQTEEKELQEPTCVELVDEEGHPIASQRYVIVLDDGTERGGVLDADGKATLDLAQGGTIRFPDLPNARH
ncbi:MAG: type VI secretion system tip protein TssI/VgrG [Polyangiaceae bacterium]